MSRHIRRISPFASASRTSMRSSQCKRLKTCVGPVLRNLSTAASNNVGTESSTTAARIVSSSADSDGDHAATLPPTMYGWRVGALRDWVRENTSNGQTLTMEKMAVEVGHLDQLHYRGLQANTDVIDVLSGGTGNLKGKLLLDAGCGIGGPARYIAWKTGCQVIGLDIQQELIDEANVLKPLIDAEFALGTDACKLYACDMTDTMSFSRFVKPNSVDGWFSHLVFLHIPLPRREESFKNLFGTLKSGGRFSIEDYVLMGREKLLPHELNVLDEVVGACAIPTKSEYEATLRSCCEKSYGPQQLEISSLDFADMSEIWTAYTAGRRESFAANRAAHVKLHGEASATMMETFYNAVADLFAGGRLGGAKITGQVEARSE